MLQLKLEKTGAGKPSRVIHIRNIPNEVTEAEIIHLGIPFGRVTNVLVLKGKNQVSGKAFHLLPRPFRALFFLSFSRPRFPPPAESVRAGRQPTAALCTSA